MRLGWITKFAITVAGVVVFGVLASSVGVVVARRAADRLQRVVTENTLSVRMAMELQIALLEQRHALAMYVLGAGNPARLPELQRAQQEFEHWLGETWANCPSAEDVKILNDLKKVYAGYLASQQRVIELHGAEKGDEAEVILRGESRDWYRQAYRFCENLIEANVLAMETAEAEVHRQVVAITWITVSCVVVTIGLGGGLLWQFLFGVVKPLRRFAREAQDFTRQAAITGEVAVENELQAMGVYLRRLMDDVTVSRSTINESRQQLAAAEKLAAVGKLAATVAHEIRNPLTAVKMWLFSIAKMGADNAELDRKVQMVTEEIRRLENIVRNFLEFSRPPRLQRQAESLTVLIDKTLDLFQYRCDGTRISLVRADAAAMPEVMADAEQFQQVLFNMLDNATAAIEGQGRISITTAVEPDGAKNSMAVVRIEDTGGGVPAAIQDRIFEPFFSTKRDGTGLGLCIAAQIMAGHGGRVVLESSDCHGTRMAIWIPLAESVS